MIDFERRFVHCFWNNELEGKKGFVENTLADLRSYVENKAIPYIVELSSSGNKNYQFTYYKDDEITSDYQFCYYDPLYEIKVAYEEGKQIQYYDKDDFQWYPATTPTWDITLQYRIKPTEEEYQVVISFDAQGLGIIQSTVSTKFRKILFTGTKEECEEWVKDNYDISIVVNGYFEDEPIVYKEKGVKNDPWRPTKDIVYNWDFDHYEYRINRAKESKEDKYVPFENTQELIEAWEKKCPANKDRPKGTMPLIWIKEKEDEYVYLISDFYKTSIGTSSKILNFESLFEEYTFADGSACGKRK